MAGSWLVVSEARRYTGVELVKFSFLALWLEGPLKTEGSHSGKFSERRLRAHSGHRFASKLTLQVGARMREKTYLTYLDRAGSVGGIVVNLWLTSCALTAFPASIRLWNK